MFTLMVYIMLILAPLNEANAYKILIVSPLPGKSHAILGEAMVDHLAKAGHEITYITVFVPDKPQPNVKIIDLSDNLEYSDGDLDLKAIMDKTAESISLLAFAPMLMNMSVTIIDHPNVRNLINDKTQQFDVIIAEWMFTEINAGFAGVFNCPLIWFSTVEPHWMVLQLVDEIPNPAYTVDILSDNYPPLTFTQRVSELYYQIFGKLMQTFWISAIENELYEKYFVPVIRGRGSSVPSLKTLKYNASLIMSNSHFSMGTPTCFPTNLVSIGGYHISTNVKPLPETLKNLMDNSKFGVIYFSMGSNLRSKHFPDVVKQDLLKMFGKLKQTVLWKFEEDLPKLPSNVHIFQWAPQQSILAHKNCVLFITHGGLLSTTESIHFGVPTIGIPVFGDQFVNVARSVNKGYAIKVDLSYEIARDLEKAIQEILNGPKYPAKVKLLSQLYHDRLVPPAKELVHWVEHVAKTQGALHLRSPAFMVPWYQKLYLDLVLVLLMSLVALKLLFKFVKSEIFTIRKEKIN